MNLIIPNRIIYAYLKNEKAKNITVENFTSMINNDKFKRFTSIGSVASQVLKYCNCDGKMVYNFLNKGDVIIHESKGVKNNIFISILSPNTSYYQKLYKFFNDFKDEIDLGGNTYVLDTNRFVCEFIRNDKTVSYE